MAGIRHLTAITICALTISACGGGGGGGRPSDTPDRMNPNLTVNDLVEALGSAKSSNAAATGALVRLLQDDNALCLRRAADDTPNCEELHGKTVLTAPQNTALTGLLGSNGEYDDLRATFPNGFSVAKDVGGKSNDPTKGIDLWWNAGWTGKGVKVAHIDDFAEATGEVDLFGNGAVLAAHGFTTQFITLQIAPEITSLRRQITDEDDTFDGHTRFEKSFFGHVKDLSENGYNIINASLSLSRIEETATDVFRPRAADDWQREVDRAIKLPEFIAAAGSVDADDALDEDLLVVFSAGNDGAAENSNSQACTGGINECHSWAAAVHQMRRNGTADAGSRFIFVGAIDVSTGRIKDYSTTAGQMVNDFIVAGDTIFDAREQDNGTSQSAPRVAGAAALMRHRWPSLDGSQLKQLLLQTAEDLGAPGPDAIYGRGRLSLENALSPVGSLSR